MMTENSYLILQLDNKNVDKKKKTLVFAVKIKYIYTFRLQEKENTE